MRDVPFPNRTLFRDALNSQHKRTSLNPAVCICETPAGCPTLFAGVRSIHAVLQGHWPAGLSDIAVVEKPLSLCGGFLKWMIGGYLYFRKPPCQETVVMLKPWCHWNGNVVAFFCCWDAVSGTMMLPFLSIHILRILRNKLLETKKDPSCWQCVLASLKQCCGVSQGLASTLCAMRLGRKCLDEQSRDACLWHGLWMSMVYDSLIIWWCSMDVSLIVGPQIIQN